MKLLDLSPQFVKHVHVDNHEEYHYVDTLAEADGIWFTCPKCHVDNKVNPGHGAHKVLCWRPKIPQTVDPKPGRWEFTGNNYGDLSLVAGSSSIQLVGACSAHFFITNGEVRMA